MSLWTPDPTFYPSPRDAAAGPPETLAYVAAFDRTAERPDALTVVDTDPASPSYGQVVGWTDMPYTGDELHHFGWNMCSSALCPYAPHPHTERRYLVVPGLRSSRIMILDTKEDPRQPPVVKVLEAGELAKRAGYSRPHTPPLWTRGHLPDLPRRGRRCRGPGRRGAAGPHVVRGARAVGARPRPAVPRVRPVVAHRPGRRGHQRVGAPPR